MPSRSYRAWWLLAARMGAGTLALLIFNTDIVRRPLFRALTGTDSLPPLTLEQRVIPVLLSGYVVFLMIKRLREFVRMQRTHSGLD